MPQRKNRSSTFDLSQRDDGETQQISSLFDYNYRNHSKRSIISPSAAKGNVPSYLFPDSMRKKGSALVPDFINQGGMMAKNPILDRPMPEAAIRSMYNNVMFPGSVIPDFMMNSKRVPLMESVDNISIIPPLPGQKYPSNPYYKVYKDNKRKARQGRKRGPRGPELPKEHLNQVLNNIKIPGYDFSSPQNDVEEIPDPSTSSYAQQLKRREIKKAEKKKRSEKEALEKAIANQWNPVCTTNFGERMVEYLRKRDFRDKKLKERDETHVRGRKKDFQDQLLQYADKELISNAMKQYQKKRSLEQKEEEQELDSEIYNSICTQNQVNIGAFAIIEQIKDQKKLTNPNWLYLEHKGPVYPLSHQTHNVNLKYNNATIIMDHMQEEVAILWVRMQFEYPDHVEIPDFRDSFAENFLKLFGNNFTDFKCFDFSDIKTFLLETEYKYCGNELVRNPSAIAAQYPESYNQEAIVNGERHLMDRNFIGQPIRLYLPKKSNKMNNQFGSIKYRDRPCTTVLNLSVDAPIPIPPGKGECWNSVISDPDLEWIIAFKDRNNNINSVSFSKKQTPGKELPCKKRQLEKFLSFRGKEGISKGIKANLCSKSQIKIYDSAYELSKSIKFIRSDYQKRIESRDKIECLCAICVYLIDNLDLKISDEKEKPIQGVMDITTTCLTFYPNCTIKLRLGPRYRCKTRIDQLVYKILKILVEERKFRTQQDPSLSKMIFEDLNVEILEQYLNLLLKDLRPQHFFIYNSSIKLQNLLSKYENVYGKKGTDSGGVFQNFSSQCSKMSVDTTRTEDCRGLVNKIVHLTRSTSKVIKISYNDHDIIKLDGIVEDLHEMYQRKRDLENDVDGESSNTCSQNSEIPNALELKETANKKLMELEENILYSPKNTQLIDSKYVYSIFDPRVIYSWLKREGVPPDRVLAPGYQSKNCWASEVPKNFQYF
ncbi:unnamed protein product [Moneuplotes crassus]|uniref:DNA topoisomerase I eukaryotic-type domain-containing protein n=1 Tax=Euplotes crassus TaxID=5936 RepID=A0AAD1Y1Z3_EUPCR|nr:unnamed protein product [Moneuplotes crassus]